MLHRDQLEKGDTHDDLWNASQREMVYHGKMSSFNRMYWAKKVDTAHMPTQIQNVYEIFCDICTCADFGMDRISRASARVGNKAQ